MPLTHSKPKAERTDSHGGHHHGHHLKNLFKKDKDASPSSSSSSLFHHRASSDVTVNNASLGSAKPRANENENEPEIGSVPMSSTGSSNSVNNASIQPNNNDNESIHSNSSKTSRTPSILSIRRHNSNIFPRSHKDKEDNDHHHHHHHHHIPGIHHHKDTPLSQQQKDERKKLSRAETMAHLQNINNKNAAARANAGPGGQRGPPSSANVNNPNFTNHPHNEKIKYNPFGINKSPSTDVPKNPSFYLNGGSEGARVVANPVADPNDYLPENLQQSHINLLEDFEIDMSTKKLGDGGSSDVRIINAISRKKQCYALKKFTLLHKESDEEFYQRAAKEFIISKVGGVSRHVVDTLTMVRIQSQANLTRGWGIVLEFCEGGDLFNTIVRPGWKRCPLNERYCIFKQIAYGLKFLHEHDIVHKDLKPENVLIDANGCAKLCDFGVSDYGHETFGDFNSDIKKSTAYVGSPPYSPPEVMKLKEVSSSETKQWAYDPFKMDHWGLGMLLFAIVYCGVPFQSAINSDHGFRDYKFNRERFTSDHPQFKNNSDYSRGPGSEFKWAAQFQSNGAARVAWKLCDPSTNTRYDLDLLFNDPWFATLEMCMYEHPEQDVNPFVTPSNFNSNVSTRPNTRPPSRKNTYNSGSTSNGNNTEDEGLHTPIRSMLDLAIGNDKDKERDRDNESIHSNSSLSTTPLKLRNDHTNAQMSSSQIYTQKQQQQQRQQQQQQHEDQGCDACSCGNETKENTSAPRSGHSSPPSKVRSMLDFTQEQQQEEQPQQQPQQQAVSPNLPAVQEDNESHNEFHESSSQLEMTAKKTISPPNGNEKAPKVIASSATSAHSSRSSSSSSSSSSSGGGSNNSVTNQDPSSKKPDCKCDCHAERKKPLPLLQKQVLRANTQVSFDANGVCDLGYKIKKHHHSEISNVAVSGALGKFPR